MKKTLKRVSCLIMSIIILLSFPINTYADEIDYDKLENDLESLKGIINDLDLLYLYDLNQDDIFRAMLNGIFSTLDDYSVCYTKEQFESFITDVSGSFSGIGVEITEEDNKIIVSMPLPNTPAQKAGIKTGDIIISVNGEDVTGYSLNKVSSLIKGEPETNVKITVLRGNEKLTFNLKRENIVASSVESDILQNNIGYLKITSFNENTTELVEAVLADFDTKNITKIIIDIRNNLGGSLTTAIDLLNLFVPEGPILHVDYALSGEETHYSYLEKQKYDICVLVNENSASASEVFAGAVQDRNAGKIIGTTTYGKGVVQSLYTWKDIDGGFKLTTAEYFTPNKNKVHGVGIKPDVVIENKIGQSKVDLSAYPELKKDRKPTLNTVGLDVLGAEMILQTLGYKVNTPDGIFDEVTFEQIKLFQKNNNLFAYGELDFDTQDALTSALKLFAEPDVEDTQLKKAIELMK